jgi:hypothetical protein
LVAVRGLEPAIHPPKPLQHRRALSLARRFDSRSVAQNALASKSCDPATAGERFDGRSFPSRNPQGSDPSAPKSASDSAPGGQAREPSQARADGARCRSRDTGIAVRFTPGIRPRHAERRQRTYRRDLSGSRTWTTGSFPHGPRPCLRRFDAPTLAARRSSVAAGRFATAGPTATGRSRVSTAPQTYPWSDTRPRRCHRCIPLRRCGRRRAEPSRNTPGRGH